MNKTQRKISFALLYLSVTITLVSFVLGIWFSSAQWAEMGALFAFSSVICAIIMFVDGDW